MYCRCCGHDNEGRDKGKCENCGFELSSQNEPSRDKRSAIQERLAKPVGFKERSEFKVPPPKGEAGKFGALIALVGLALAVLFTNTSSRSEYVPPPPVREVVEDIVEEQPEDSIASLIGSDIVYVFNDSASFALPRANVDMNLIPAGATVSFLGPGIVPLYPAASYIVQKISQRDFDPLTVDRICIWTDSARTEFISAPLTRLPRVIVDSTTAPVLIKFYFTPEMLRGSVEEFSIQYDVAIFTDDFSQSQLNNLISTVADRLDRADPGEREIKVAALFDYEAYDLGDAVDIMNRIEAMVIDSMGWDAFSVSVFTLTD